LAFETIKKCVNKHLENKDIVPQEWFSLNRLTVCVVCGLVTSKAHPLHKGCKSESHSTKQAIVDDISVSSSQEKEEQLSQQQDEGTFSESNDEPNNVSPIITEIVTPELQPNLVSISPSMEDILSFEIPLYEHIPYSVKENFSRILTSLLRDLTFQNSVRCWRDYFMFCKCVLWKLPKAKLPSGQTITMLINGRLIRWKHGERDVLWSEIPKEQTSLDSCRMSAGENVDNETHRKQLRYRRVMKNINEGNLSRAMNCLRDAPLVRPSEESLKIMCEKHPQPFHMIHEVATEEQLGTKASVHVSTEDVLFQLKKFPRSTVAGQDVLRANHILECIDVVQQTSLLEQLTYFVNSCLSGKINEDVRAYFGGAKLIAL